MGSEEIREDCPGPMGTLNQNIGIWIIQSIDVTTQHVRSFVIAGRGPAYSGPQC